MQKNKDCWPSSALNQVTQKYNQQAYRQRPRQKLAGTMAMTTGYKQENSAAFFRKWATVKVS